MKHICKSFLISSIIFFVTLCQVWAHDYNEQGICTETGCTDPYEPPVMQEGWYLLSNAGNVEWFSALVNQGGNDVNLWGKMVADIEQLKQTVKDTLDIRSGMVKAVENFANADQLIMSQVPVYKKLYKRAFQLSLVQKLTPQLEKLKARESLIFEKLQAGYEAAKSASEQVPSLQPRMNVIDEQFVVMKSVSEKIQALEYKPIIQRVKDYLLGLAAVAVILLFISMLRNKYKAYKDKLANMKKLDEMMKKQGKGTQYPTI